MSNWFGVSAPAKAPVAIVERLHADIVRALATPDLRATLGNAGADPVGSSPAQYTVFIQSEIAKWGKVIRAAGIKGE